MKHLLILTLALAMSVVARAEEKTSPAAAPAGDEAAIRKLELAWFAAFAKGDAAAMDSAVTNDDCMFADPSGQIFNIRQLHADVKSGAYTVASSHVDEMKVVVYGDAAVVFGLETEKSKYKGEDTSGQYRFTDTWVKRNGKWVCVASANTRVTPPKP